MRARNETEPVARRWMIFALPIRLLLRVPFLYAAPECGPKSPAVGEKNDFAGGAREPRYFRFEVINSVLD